MRHYTVHVPAHIKDVKIYVNAVLYVYTSDGSRRHCLSMLCADTRVVAHGAAFIHSAFINAESYSIQKVTIR